MKVKKRKKKNVVFCLALFLLFITVVISAKASAQTIGSGARIIDCNEPYIPRFHFGGEVGSCEYVMAEPTGDKALTNVTFTSSNPAVCTVTECDGYAAGEDTEDYEDVYYGKHWRLDRIAQGTALITMSCMVGENQVVRTALVSAYTSVPEEPEGIVLAGQTVYFGCSTQEGITSKSSEIKELLTENREVIITHECNDFYRVESLDGAFGELEEDWGYVLKSSVYIPIKELQMSEEFSTYEGSTIALDASVTPELATDKQIIYQSSNTNVAIVDEGGNVTGVHSGRAVITAYAKSNPTLICRADIEVYPYNPVSGIQIKPDSLTIQDGTKGKLSVEVLPENASIKDYQLSVDKNEYLMIDANGYYQAKKPGVAVVTAVSKDGNFVANCTITILRVEATSVALQENISIDVNETKQLSWHMVPENASDKRVTFWSSNPEVVSVDELGRVTGKSVGKATIYLSTAQGGFQKSCLVQVEKYVKDIELNENLKEMTLYEKEALKTEVSPSDVTKKELIWNSDNKKVVRVTKEGVISAVGTGVAKVTVYDKYTGAYDFCMVDVDANLATPTLQKEKKEQGNYLLKWKKVKRATGYKVYKYNKKRKKYIVIKTLKKSTCTYPVKYTTQSGTYKLKAYYKPNKEYSKFSKKVKVVCK